MKGILLRLFKVIALPTVILVSCCLAFIPVFLGVIVFVAVNAFTYILAGKVWAPKWTICLYSFPELLYPAWDWVVELGVKK